MPEAKPERPEAERFISDDDAETAEIRKTSDAVNGQADRDRSEPMRVT
jgi:hypothetical protein